MNRLLLAAILVMCGSITARANTCVPLQAGATDQSVYVEFIDEATGVPNSSLAFNTSGIDLEYVRSGAAATDITEATQTAAGAHSDGGFVSVGHGRYRLDLPDAAVATGVPQVVVQGVITGYIMLPCVVALSPPVNVVRYGGTDGTFTSGRPEVNASHIAGSAVSTSTAQIGVNVVNAGGTAWGSGAITAAAIAADAIGAAEVAADVSTELLSGLANLAVNVAQISGDSAVADRFEAMLDSTCGSYPELGVLRGVGCTAQAYTAGIPSLTLDTSAAFGDNTLTGATILICGSTQGYCQPATAASNVGSSDVVTLTAALPVAATGTITYTIFGTATASGNVNVTQVEGTDATDYFATLDDAIMTRVGAPVGASISADLQVIDTNVDDVEADTADMQPKLGTYSDLGSGATLSGNLEDMRDDGTAAYSRATDSLQAIRDRGDVAWTGASTNITQIEGTDATDQIDARVQAQLQLYRLDELVAADSDIDGAAPPTIGSVFHELMSSATGAFGFDQTTDSLQAIRDNLAGGAADWTADERTAMRSILGIPASGTTPDDPTTGILDTIRDDTAVLGTPAGASFAADIAAVKSDTAAILIDTAEIGTAGAGLTAVDDAVLAAIAALNDLSATDVGNLTIEDQGGGVSLRCALAVLLSYAAGDLTTSSNSPTYEDPSGTETRISGAVSSAGNRTMSITCPTY